MNRFALLLLVVIGCQQKKEARSVPYAEDTQQQEMKEVEKTKTAVITEDVPVDLLWQDSTPSFPGRTYSKVIVHQLNGQPGSRAQSVFELQTGKSAQLDSVHLVSFLKLINDPKSYGNLVAACHDPRVGMILYDSDDKVTSYLSLCMACNNLYTAPQLTLALDHNASGFSLESRKKLHSILEGWGLPDWGFSPLFDDEELYLRYLKHHDYTEKEIQEKLEEYRATYGSQE